MARTNTRRTGPRPRYSWVPARDNENTVVSGQVVSTDLLDRYRLDSLREPGPGMVVERIIGSLTVASQVTGSGGDFTMGISVAPEGGWSSAPNPSDEIQDWLLWLSGRFPTGANEQSAGVFQPDEMTYQFDVRARRRLRGMADEVLAVVRNPNSTSMIWTLNTRILLRVS